MDIKAYISSGVIENYVLGLVSEEERKNVLRMQEQYPEVAEAVKVCEESLENFAALHAVKPPAELKAKVLDTINEQRTSGFSSDTSATKTVAKQLYRWKRIAVAAILLFFISAGVNIFYLPKYKQYKEDHLLLVNNQERILAKNKALKSSMQKMQNDIQVLMNPDVQPVVMRGVNNHDGMVATVFWNKKNRQPYLGKANLPAPPPGKTYQLWAIVNGKPVDLGIYNPKNDKEPKTMKAISKGEVQAFAITLEKEGGSTTPTMDQMYVMGAAS